MRLPTLTREELAPSDQAIWDGIKAVRPGPGGPFAVLLHVPVLAEKVAALEDFFRFNGKLTEAERELVIMATTREMGARYPWTRHEARGREVGVPDASIEVLRVQGSVQGLTPREQVLVEVTRSLLRDHAIPDELFKRAEADLGKERLLETVALVGHYSLIACVANGFQVEAPEGAKTF